MISPGKSPLFLFDATLHDWLSAVESNCRLSHQFSFRVIGQSREARDIYGFQIGRGPNRVSITAGAHADEPGGPMAAGALIKWLTHSQEADHLLERFTFFVCPQINPDGAQRNSVWFRDPVDPREYFKQVVREKPGDDIEFGYPDPARLNEDTGVRPENRAVAGFLKQHGPFCFHASLHGMAFAEGAWFLIGREWTDRTRALRLGLAQSARELRLPLHDIERNGEKGFFRIERGFCTTPTSVAMKEHFLGVGEPETAELFRLSSMEFVQQLGGNPLVMVSELPLMLISSPSHPPSDPPAKVTAYTAFRERLGQAKIAWEKGPQDPWKSLSEFRVEPLSFSTQVTMIMEMVLEGIRFAASR